jgi:uncharacterized membrane protein YphA (DoxX/SURF4 family)
MRIKSLLRLLFGIIWILAGISKIVMFEKITTTLSLFGETCMIPFYAELIKTFIVPNTVFTMFVVIILELIAGILILLGKNFSKIGLYLGILMNIVYLPLFPPATIIINSIFIIFQAYILKYGELEENYFMKIKSIF